MLNGAVIFALWNTFWCLYKPVHLSKDSYVMVSSHALTLTKSVVTFPALLRKNTLNGFLYAHSFCYKSRWPGSCKWRCAYSPAGVENSRDVTVAVVHSRWKTLVLNVKPMIFELERLHWCLSSYHYHPNYIVWWRSMNRVKLIVNKMV